MVGASTLTVAAQVGEENLAPAEAEASVSSVPGPAETYDLNEVLTRAILPTANLITIRIDTHGTASFALPQAEEGQGITTSGAMLIAEELDLPLTFEERTVCPPAGYGAPAAHRCRAFQVIQGGRLEPQTWRDSDACTP